MILLLERMIKDVLKKANKKNLIANCIMTTWHKMQHDAFQILAITRRIYEKKGKSIIS